MNTPIQPGGGSDNGNVPPHNPSVGSDPLANNPYSTQYQQAPSHNLDANAPVLQAGDMQRMNRRALFFLAIIILLLVVVAFWLFKSARTPSPAKPKAQETITVPEAPKPVAPILPVMPPPTTPIPMVVQPPLPPPQAVKPKPAGPSLLDRRIANSMEASASPDASTPPGGNTANQSQSRGSLDGVDTAPTSAQPLVNPDTLLTRGTFIRCVLETRIVSDFPGYTSCVVSEPVYSFNGRRLLLPKGSKVLGTYKKQPVGNRMIVIWDRIITPTGIDVNMSSPGIDQLGGSGDPGYLDSHWPSRIGSALLISMLSDAFSYEAAEHGPKTTTVTSGVAVENPFQSNTAQTLQNLSQQAVQASANRPATVTINQGTLVDVYVAKDVDFSGVVAKF